MAWSVHNKNWAAKRDPIHGDELTLFRGTILSAGILIVGWFIVWTPFEYFGRFYYYIFGLYPYFIWLTCVSAFSLVLLIAARFGINLGQAIKFFKEQRFLFIFTGITLVIFIFLAAMAAFRVVGVKPADEDFWYGAGTPVLAIQVLISLLLGFGLTMLLSRLVSVAPAILKWVDLIAFLLIWIFTAWLWAAEPARPDFFITIPVAPNYEVYPDYDARTFDLMSQFALIGQGINNSSFYDRALYPAFLVYLHNIVGQDYQRLVAFQAALFGILPALLYLVGKRIFGRAAGMGVGILASLRGFSHISVGDIINTAHPKHLLTDYLTAVLIAAATFLIIRWIQKPSKDWPLAGFAGGILGLSTLLRPHPLFLIPAIVGLAILVYKKRVRWWFGVSSLIVAAAILSVLPWTQLSGHDISIADLYMQRIYDVIRQRYPQILKPGGNQPQIVTTTPTQDLIAPEPVSPLPQRGVQTSEKPVLAFAMDNYLNNLVTSIQILPSTPFNLNARDVVKKTDNFWISYWDGSLTPWARILLPINLLLVALGIGAAWKHARVSGLVPLIFMLAYFGANAFARTSGGRYIVPLDWVVVLYYVLGLMTSVTFAGAFFGIHACNSNRMNIAILVINETDPNEINLVDNSSASNKWRTVALILIASFAVGSLIPVSQSINPRRFQPTSTGELASLFIDLAGKRTAISPADLREFFLSSDAVILTGRSLYVRQFIKDEGLAISNYNFYHPLPYPRTLFTLIGPAGERVIIFPRTTPAEISNASDVMVLGCKMDRYIQAWAVVNLENNAVFTPLPYTPLVPCPLPEPVCDNNKKCH